MHTFGYLYLFVHIPANIHASTQKEKNKHLAHAGSHKEGYNPAERHSRDTAVQCTDGSSWSFYAKARATSGERFPLSTLFKNLSLLLFMAVFQLLQWIHTENLLNQLFELRQRVFQ